MAVDAVVQVTLNSSSQLDGSEEEEEQHGMPLASESTANVSGLGVWRLIADYYWTDTQGEQQHHRRLPSAPFSRALHRLPTHG